MNNMNSLEIQMEKLQIKPNIKTKACNNVIYEEDQGVIGYCRRSNCDFAHSLSELVLKPCFTERIKGKCENQTCIYLHINETNLNYFDRMKKCGGVIPKLPLESRKTWVEESSIVLKELDDEIKEENEENEEDRLILSLCRDSIMNIIEPNTNKKEIVNLKKEEPIKTMKNIKIIVDSERLKDVKNILRKCNLVIDIQII
jgi:hypothetical protein